MRVTRIRRWVNRHEVCFEGLSESEADAPGGRRPGRREAQPARVPIVFDCPRSRAPRPIEECLSCSYFVCQRPVPGRRQVRLCCVCTDQDPILRSVERRATWPCVGPETALSAAHRLAIVHDLPLVLVAERDGVIGVVYREQLCSSREPVSSRMTQYPWSLSARATLGDAVEALRAAEVPALLVLGVDQQLVAVVSVDHLVRLGVPAELIPPRRAASPGC